MMGGRYRQLMVKGASQRLCVAALMTSMMAASTSTVRAFSTSCSLGKIAKGADDGNGVRMMTSDPFSKGDKGKILVLGGSGFLGGTIAKRAVLEGYSVTSLSRRGKPNEPSSTSETDPNSNSQSTSGTTGIRSGTTTEHAIDYKIGDARDPTIIQNILDNDDDDYVAVIHCIGLLFDGDSGLGNLNRLVSGSGSVPEETSTYDDITRRTAFNAIQAAEQYARKRKLDTPLPFIFTSAAEAGWPDVAGGQFVESTLAPEWLRRYLVAKRAVESRLLKNGTNNNDDDTTSTAPPLIRPVIFRPSLIYSLDRLASLPPVGAFFVGNKIGLPFVDRPVTVQSLSCAAVRSIGQESVRGVQRFMQIDELSK